MVKGFLLSFGCWCRFSDTDWLFVLKNLLQPCYNISGRNLPWLLLYNKNGGCQVCKGVHAFVLQKHHLCLDCSSTARNVSQQTCIKGDPMKIFTSAIPIHVSKFRRFKINYLQFESDLLVCNFCFYTSTVTRIRINTCLHKAGSRNLGCLHKPPH